MTTSQEPPAVDARVNAAVQEYLERIDRGEVVDKERFLAKYPADIADSVRSFIEGSENLAKLARRSEASVISTNSAGADASLVKPPAKPQAKSTAPGGSQFDVLPADFGRYRVQKLLGRGAMGAVFLADDRQLERQVALKIPSFEQEKNADLLTRFYREARSAAMLRQPNICPVYDVGEIDGQHYITMAYIAGRTLSEFIRSDKPPGERQTLLIARKLALALQEAHAQGIIHRDLKPGNVMIDARGEPIVMDFGLACRMEQEDAARLTHSGVIVGSPAYMSPEQVEGNPDNVTPSADQYSLGVILYEMLTGQLPFKGSITAVIAQITTKAPKPPRELKSEIDPRVEAVCLRMLSKAAKDRFPSLKAVADELAIILREPKSATATPVNETTTIGSTASVGTSMVDRQREIQTLLKDGNLTAAQEALKGLAALTDPRQQKSADWAKQQLAKLKADDQRWETEAPQLIDLAKQLVRKHDYADAAKLLGQVPLAFRSPALSDLLEQATDKQDECDALLADIDQAVRKEQSKELPALVKRLLQLKPGHTGVQRLAADMKKYGVERAMRVRKGDRNYLDPAGQVWNPKHIAYAACGLAALCFAAYSAVITFQTKHGTVVVEVKDPGLNVSFHNDIVTLESSGKKYQLKPTDQQTLEIEHDGLTFVSPTIEVKKGDVTQVVAYLEASKPALTVNGVPQVLTPQSLSAPPQPFAGLTFVDSTDSLRQQFGLDAESVGPILTKLDPGFGLRHFDSEQPQGGHAVWMVSGLGPALRLYDDSVFTEPKTVLELMDAILRHVVSPQQYADALAANAKNPNKLPKISGELVGKYQVRLVFNKTKADPGTRALIMNFDQSEYDALVAYRDWLRRQSGNSSIPADAVVHNGHSYKFFPEKLSWTEAKKRCEALGGHLPTIADEFENRFVQKTAQAAFPADETGPLKSIWLGASDAAKEGDWQWSNGEEMTYKNWFGQQPNNGGLKADEHFATMMLSPGSSFNEGQWSDQPDVSTQQTIHLVCEWDGVAGAGTQTSSNNRAAERPTSLFNGKDLTGWVESPAGSSNWKVVDGVLVGHSQERNGFLISDRGDYRNFRLTAEAMYEATNSGLYFRAQRDGDKVGRGFEADMLSSKISTTGSLYLTGTTPVRTAQVAQGPSPTPGQWFTMTVECIDQDISVAIDGRNVVKYRDEANYAASGHIMLQAYLGPIRYRSISIVELPSAANAQAPSEAGFTDLFNGRNLDGWEGDKQPWEAKDGVLASRVPTEPGRSYLLTERDYSDFELRLQFRLLNDGKSGVLYRAQSTALGDVTGHLADLGYLRLNDADLENMTGDLSRPRSKPAATTAERPGREAALQMHRLSYLSHAEGQRRDEINGAYRTRDWNDLTVRCVGGHEVVELNGVTTADITNLDGPRSGKIGFQAYRPPENVRIASTPRIEFRNVRIKELSTPPVAAAAPPAGFTELFNGRNFDGWEGEQQLWTIENGELVSRM
ncbi:MAG TPA: family 16 glycoside hydrolase, partial [Planctomycetaceae bacterium]|nr:family 16 glycoside hydrolase [Planctomycetaceae bacterium]